MNVSTRQALFVHSVVTSRPASNRVIVDAGFKALPRWFSPGYPLGMAGVVEMAMSAEHGVITLEAPDHCISVGDRFDFVVGYGDTTVCLHDTLYAMRDDVVEAVWPISARGKLQ